MSQLERKTRRAGKVILKLYESLDPIITQRTTEKGTTCREGCSSCCKLPASATVAEMAPVVSYLSDRKAVRALEQRIASYLEVAASFVLNDPADRARFFKTMKMDCVFLRDNKCEIYPLRPASCRFHYVVSHPKHCGPDDKRGVVDQIDLVDIEDYVVLTGASELGEMAGGPIAAAFVMAAQDLGIEFKVHSRRDLDRASWRVPITESNVRRAEALRTDRTRALALQANAMLKGMPNDE